MNEQILKRLNIQQLNSMQEAAIEAIIPGNDIILLSPTGSGKTLAFLLPLLKMIDSKSVGVQALILAPSRELALQIEQVFRQMQTGLKVNTCYGGHAMRVERNNLKEPPALLIGTPGRIADHLRRENFDPSTINILVLDEFDKSLELGFKAEMELILRQLGQLKTRVLTSATSLNEIPEFTGVKNPGVLDFAEHALPQQLRLLAVRAADSDKLHLLFRLICHLGNAPALVFCNHREAVERISEVLYIKGIMHGIYHGGLEQDQRELALIRFRNGTHNVLLTTDLAARGLDIPEIQHVVHYQIPVTETAWTHRNGRTARMHASGSAWLVLAVDDYVPAFLESDPEFIVIPDNIKLPEPSPWETIYLGVGKKDKVSKGDVAGFLIQKGKLPVDGLGKIEVLDYMSFVAVKRPLVNKMLRRVQHELIKRKSAKIEIAE